MVLSLLNIQSVLVAQPPNVHCKRVDQESLKCAMETVLKNDTGPEPAYDPKATTNGIRYQTDVIIYLLENGARQVHKQPEEACLLFIGYKDWYEAFKSVHCQNKEPPKYVIKAYEAKQNIVIDYDRRKVIKEIDSGDIPDIAANVALYWESKDKSFFYIDDLSKPKLRVINEKNITYRLLKYKDDNLIVCDQIHGLKGRAKEGFLRILGKARMTQYRIVPAEDRAQYVLMETKKWFFTWKNDLKIGFDGVTTDGVSNEKAKQTLHRKIKIQYEHSSKDLDYLLIPSAQVAECDCN